METKEYYKDTKRHCAHGHYPHGSHKSLIGIILVLIGVFLLMRNTGIFPGFIAHVVFSWPMLLVTVGLILTLGASEKRSGIIVMAVGAFFLIPKIFHETFHAYDLFWPSIFIIIGVIFLATRYRSKHSASSSEKTDGNDYIDYVNIFSGGERQIVSDNFKGGKITAIFGGNELDLTQAKLAEGISELEISCVFGGTTIIVPNDWHVVIDVTPILGGFSDSRKIIPGKTTDTSKQLLIKGTVIFGGGEIKSY